MMATMKKTTSTALLSACLVLGMGFLQGCNDDNNTSSGSTTSPPPPLLDAFDPDAFPIDMPSGSNGAGQLAFSASGDILAIGYTTQDIVTISRPDGTISTLTVNGNGGALSSIVESDSGELYLGDSSGFIYLVDTDTGILTSLGNLGAYTGGLVIAPAGFGAFEGQIIAATFSGIKAFDPAGPTITDIGSNTAFSDLEFAADGTLYVVGGTQVDIVTADGTRTNIATIGGSDLDGIAVDSDGNRLFVADSQNDILYSVAIADGTETSLGSYDFDSGTASTGLAYDGIDLFMLTGETDGTPATIEIVTTP